MFRNQVSGMSGIVTENRDFVNYRTISMRRCNWNCCVIEIISLPLWQVLERLVKFAIVE